ncbi:MAG: hypothetical protein JEY71_16550 [Sphaerochaeta sp.]|nr:hypothetical protein [Sphaerochaeta sp.]
MENNTELKQHSKTFYQAYEKLETYILVWSQQSKPLMREVKTQLLLEEDGEYLEGYFNYSASALVLQRVLTDVKMLKRIQRTQEKFMVRREKEILSLLIEKPAFWCFFTIKEVLDDEFILIEDLFRGNTHLMYAPTLILRKKIQGLQQANFLSLMIQDGECILNIALLRVYFLNSSDMLFYCSLFAGIGLEGIRFTGIGFDTETTLGDVINDHYNDFFTLDKVDAAITVMRGKHEQRHTWQPFSLEKFDIHRLGGTWTATHVGNQTRYDLVEMDEEMIKLPHARLWYFDLDLMDGLMVRDHNSGEMGLMNNSEISYSIFAATLQRAYPELVLPQQPEISIPVTLYFNIFNLDLTTPWEKFNEVRTYGKEA